MKTFARYLAAALFFTTLQLKADDGAHKEQAISHEASTLEQVEMVIYKNQGCTCCDKWATHLEETNIETKIEVSEHLEQLKAKLGVHPKLTSCHTGVVKQQNMQYVFEGHVPSKFIQQFLSNPPEGTIGLSVPAMPVGSPGMEYQDKFMPYKVFLLHKNGQVSVFANVENAEEQYQ